MRQFAKSVNSVIKGILSRKTRSALTILGVVIGVAGVIIIISLGAGAQSLVLGQITKLGTNLIGVLPGASDESGPPAAVFGVQIKTLKVEDGEAIVRQVPGIEALSSIVSGSATVIYGNQSVDTSFQAVDGNYPKIQNIEVDQGEFFSEEEARSSANVIFLGRSVADSLFPSGDALGKVVKLRVGGEKAVSVPLRVVGVQEKTGTVAFQDQDDQVYIPFKIGQKQILGIDYVQFMRMKVGDGEVVKDVIEDVKQVLRDQHGIKDPSDDDFSVRDLADAIKLLSGITDALRMFLGLMAGISLIVGGIGIMNIMLVTVSERTREIGLRKAIGATNSQMRNQFLLEAVILTSAGGVVGITIGILISYAVSAGVQYAGYSDWAFIISPVAILLAVGVSVLTGIVFGLYPAFKASKLDPIVALRYE